MNISVVQFDAKPGEVQFNLNKIKNILLSIKPGQTDVVVFPEMVDTGYEMKTIKECAVVWNDGHLNTIKKLAVKKEISIVIGLAERVNNKIFNSTAIIDKEGNLICKYRKTHLVTINPICEEKTISPGKKLGLFCLFGIKMGVMTCYELRFPEIARSLTLQGAKVLFVPSAWPLVRKDHFVILLAARAIENQIFIVTANRVGTDKDTTFAGNSMVIDPFGKILVQGNEGKEEILTTTVNLEDITNSRAQIQALKERRPDLYRL
jgi:predicted amidohydrolase